MNGMFRCVFGWLLAAFLTCFATVSPAAAQPVTFPADSLIIPMDTTYQDYGMLKAFGLVYRLQSFVDAGLLDEHDARTLQRLQPHNPLLFEFVLKRTLAVQGTRLAPEVFETRRVFERRAS